MTPRILSLLALCATLAACGGGNVDECADYRTPLMMAPAPTVGAAAVTLPQSSAAPTIGTHLVAADTMKTAQPMPPVGDDGGDIPSCDAIARR